MTDSSTTPAAFVIIDHGSRRTESNRALAERCQSLSAAMQTPVFAAHMELAEPTLAQAIAQAVSGGCGHIKVLPFFLGPGRHIQEDIPALVKAAQQRFPKQHIELLPALGEQPQLNEALSDILRHYF